MTLYLHEIFETVMTWPTINATQTASRKRLLAFSNRSFAPSVLACNFPDWDVLVGTPLTLKLLHRGCAGALHPNLEALATPLRDLHRLYCRPV